MTDLDTTTLERMCLHVLAHASYGDAEFDTNDPHDPLVTALRHGADDDVKLWVETAWAHETGAEDWMHPLLVAAGRDPHAYGTVAPASS